MQAISWATYAAKVAWKYSNVIDGIESAVFLAVLPSQQTASRVIFTSSRLLAGYIDCKPNAPRIARIASVAANALSIYMLPEYSVNKNDLSYQSIVTNITYSWFEMRSTVSRKYLDPITSAFNIVNVLYSS